MVYKTQKCNQSGGLFPDNIRRKKLMNKTELIAAVAEKAELSKKDAEKAVKAFTDVVSEELVKGGKVQLVGFGTFEVAERAAREGRNPKTGNTMTIAASRTPKFKAGKALKDEVNK
ncbi:MAG: HU family DNA-binding protein [Enterocloster sp.]